LLRCPATIACVCTTRRCRKSQEQIRGSHTSELSGVGTPPAPNPAAHAAQQSKWHPMREAAAGRAPPRPFCWPTEMEKFCLGVNSVTPKPFVSISFVSTGTKFGRVTMNLPTWIESEKAISHCQFLSLIAFVFGWYKVLCSEKALVTRKKRKKRLTLLPLFYKWRNE